MEDHGGRDPPVRLSTEMVELFRFYADELLKEATLMRDRELIAGALFEMVCTKFMHCESFLSAL